MSLASPATLLGRLIASASPGCRVFALAKVPSVAWPFLAAGQRTDPTFENAKGYIDELGGVDEHLAALLGNHQGLTETEGKPETDQRRPQAHRSARSRGSVGPVRTCGRPTADRRRSRNPS